MERTKETATSTTQRRGMLRGHLSLFLQKRRWRSLGFFLSSRGEVEMNLDPRGQSKRGNGDTDDAKEKDAA